MNWPVVWRSTYEHAQAWEPLYRRAMQDYERIYQHNIALNAELLLAEVKEPVRLMDREKAVVAVPRIPSPLEKRIEEVSEGDGRIKRHFWQYVARERKAGKSDGDILGEIRWQTTEAE